MKRCAQGDLTGILDFYQLVINETEDMSATGMQRTPGEWIFICLNFFFKNRIPC